MTKRTIERTTREWRLIAYVLGDLPASADLRAWLATAAGRDALAHHRRVLRGLDAWGATVGGSAGVAREQSQATAGDVVYYGRLATPLGPVLAALSARGLVGVRFGRGARAFGAGLARRHRTTIVRADDRLAPIRTQLDEYFSGRRRRFELPLDLRHVSSFQRRVLEAARRIPPGRVLSYGELARRIGQPRACRAVGQALGNNPVPIVIPCHRVVAGGGALGGYVGGSAIKRRLLALEAGLARTGT